MKIAIIGIRGVPVIYSGFESFAETLTVSLGDRYDFFVYCRSPYIQKKLVKYYDVNLIHIPTISVKNFESIIHGLFSTLHACFILRPHIIYYLGAGNAFFILIANLFKIKTIINVDGLDWKREKWSLFAKLYLKLSELVASKNADTIITDSLYIKKYYLQAYHRKTIYIPYMFDPKLANFKGDMSILSKYRLEKDKYIVWVGRLVPDNHLEDLIDAYNSIRVNYKCVVIGDDLYKSSYRTTILEKIENGKGFVHTGFLSREDCAYLVKNALAYIETKRSGGTHPSLIEAAHLCNQIVCYDLESHKDILSRLGICPTYYNNAKKEIELQKILKSIKKVSTKTVKSDYLSIRRISKKYEKIFKLKS